MSSRQPRFRDAAILRPQHASHGLAAQPSPAALAEDRAGRLAEPRPAPGTAAVHAEEELGLHLRTADFRRSINSSTRKDPKWVERRYRLG
jgi:hypothetical protein